MVPDILWFRFIPQEEPNPPGLLKKFFAWSQTHIHIFLIKTETLCVTLFWGPFCFAFGRHFLYIWLGGIFLRTCLADPRPVQTHCTLHAAHRWRHGWQYSPIKRMFTCLSWHSTLGCACFLPFQSCEISSMASNDLDDFVKNLTVWSALLQG